MKYCRAVPEVVKSKENLAYLKDFISKVGYENSSEVCFMDFFEVEKNCEKKILTEYLLTSKYE
jgi:hypothetical protein